MKKIITLFLFSIFFVSSITTVSAKILTNKEGSVDIAKDEIVNDDLLIGAKSVTLDGTINGDVFIGAETTVINGTINGNLHLGSKSVVLKGKVKGNVYVGSQNITITESTIGGSLLMGAASASIDKNTVIDGSVFAGAANITLDSQIGRNLYLGAGTALIQDNAKIGMDLYYAYNEDNNNINISENALISGETHKKIYQTPSKSNTKNFTNYLKPAKSALSLFSLISALIIGFIYLKFFNKHFIDSSSIVSKKFWKSLGIGFLILIGIFPAVLILLITIVGIPIIGILLLLLTLFICLSKFIVSLALGDWITTKLKWKKVPEFWIFALGLVVIYLLKAVPVIGGITSFVVMTTGLGALTLHLLEKK